MLKHITIGGFCFLFLFFISSFFICFTFTESIAPGIYIRAFSDIDKNKYVKFFINKKFQKTWLQNRFLMKKIAAVEGDYVEISLKGYFVNKKFLGPVFEYTHNGEKLPIYNFKGLVPENYIFVVGDNSIYSYDSRYFGPIKIQQITLLNPFIIF